MITEGFTSSSAHPRGKRARGGGVRFAVRFGGAIGAVVAVGFAGHAAVGASRRRLAGVLAPARLRPSFSNSGAYLGGMIQ